MIALNVSVNRQKKKKNKKKTNKQNKKKRRFSDATPHISWDKLVRWILIGIKKYLPLHIKCEGVLWSLLSVCLCVCHFVCKHNNSRMNHPILMKFGQIVYNHNRKVKFEDGLCPLIVKATAVKKPLEMMKISHYKSDFQHIDVKFAQLM